MLPLINQNQSTAAKNHSICMLPYHGKHDYAQAHPSTNRSADLFRTDRFQPGRGCTSQTSQRLHNPGRAIQRLAVAGERNSHGLRDRRLNQHSEILQQPKTASEMSVREDIRRYISHNPDGLTQRSLWREDIAQRIQTKQLISPIGMLDQNLA
jgi:hypothetical protein